MSKIKAQLLSYFQGLPQGAILSRSEVEQAIGVSSRSVDRLIAAQQELEQAGIKVVTVTSFIKIGEVVSDQGEPIGSAEQNGVNSAKSELSAGVNHAKCPTPDKPQATPSAPQVSLPEGYRIQWHRWTNRWVAVDANGAIDPAVSAMLEDPAEAPGAVSAAADFLVDPNAEPKEGDF